MNNESNRCLLQLWLTSQDKTEIDLKQKVMYQNAVIAAASVQLVKKWTRMPEKWAKVIQNRFKQVWNSFQTMTARTTSKTMQFNKNYVFNSNHSSSKHLI